MAILKIILAILVLLFFDNVSTSHLSFRCTNIFENCNRFEYWYKKKKDGIKRCCKIECNSPLHSCNWNLIFFKYFLIFKQNSLFLNYIFHFSPFKKNFLLFFFFNIFILNSLKFSRNICPTLILTYSNNWQIISKNLQPWVF